MHSNESPHGATDRRENETDAPLHTTGQTSTARRATPILVGGSCVALALQLPLGSMTRPGPGLWPLICGLLTLGAAVLALSTPPGEEEQPFTLRSNWVLLAAATLVAFTVAMPLVGFELGLLGLMVVWLKVLGDEGWRVTLLVAFGSTAAFYLLFVTGLGLEIPRLL